MRLNAEQEKQLSQLTDTDYYTAEQKREAITTYLLGGGSLASISKQFGIKGSSTLVKWLKALGLYESNTKASVRYSIQFKMEVAHLAQLGLESYEGLRLKYNIKGSMTIARWCKQYPIKPYLQVSKRKAMKHKDKALEEALARIKTLEAEVAKNNLRLEVYEEIVAIAKRDYNLDLKKKYNSKQSPT